MFPDESERLSMADAIDAAARYNAAQIPGWHAEARLYDSGPATHYVSYWYVQYLPDQPLPMHP